MTTDTLHERDFVTWTQRQAGALGDAARQGAHLPIDRELAAEEIDDPGREIRSKVRSLAFPIQAPLLEIACSRADGVRLHGLDEVDESRTQLVRQPDGNHALRSRFGGLSSIETGRAVRTAGRLSRRSGETGFLPGLAEWERRGLAGGEVVADGAHPEPGTPTLRAEAG